MSLDRETRFRVAPNALTSFEGISEGDSHYLLFRGRIFEVVVENIHNTEDTIRLSAYPEFNNLWFTRRELSMIASVDSYGMEFWTDRVMLFNNFDDALLTATHRDYPYCNSIKLMEHTFRVCERLKGAKQIPLRENPNVAR